MANPPNYKWMVTEDGSRTLFSEAFQETCHSTSGAETETLLHYVEGCQIKKKKPLSILEVGFGLGVGFLATFESLKNNPKPWTYLSVEMDEELLEWFRLESTLHEFLKDLHWTTQNEVKVLECKNELIHLTILCGNARVTLPKFMHSSRLRWNAIYQDAFSPKRNPILWTKEWFELLRLYSAPDVTLSTYSSSSAVRKSLLEANWTLQNGAMFGGKRTSTRASLQLASDPDIILHLEKSQTPALRDDNIVPTLPK